MRQRNSSGWPTPVESLGLAAVALAIGVAVVLIVLAGGLAGRILFEGVTAAGLAVPWAVPAASVTLVAVGAAASARTVVWTFQVVQRKPETLATVLGLVGGLATDLAVEKHARVAVLAARFRCHLGRHASVWRGDLGTRGPAAKLLAIVLIALTPLLLAANFVIAADGDIVLALRRIDSETIASLGLLLAALAGLFLLLRVVEREKDRAAK